MQTTVKILEGLNRELLVTVPIANFNEKFEKVLNDLKGKVKIDGFRQGKVPVNVIKQRYATNIKSDAANELVSEVLPKAFKAEDFNPAGQPSLTNIDFDNVENFSFTVQFEVFPTIALSELNELKIEKTISSITQEDEDKTLEGLKEQVAEFEVVDRESENGDRLKIDFKGFVEGVAFDGGEAKDFAIILGKNTMIPGFEDRLIGKKIDKEFSFEVPFPEDYNAKDLAGKTATFEVKINSIEASKEVVVNDEFAKKFDKNNVDELLAGIKRQMQIQLDEKLDQINKNAAFSALLEANELEVPKISIEKETEHLLKDMNDRMEQQGMSGSNTQLEASVVNAEATRRVKLGLLVGEVTIKNKLKASDEDVQNKLKTMAANYGEQSEQMINYYNTNPEALDSIRSMVVEKLASNFIISNAQTSEVEKPFSEVVRN